MLIIFKLIFFLTITWMRRAQGPRESQGPQPWMHNRLGDPLGGSAQGPRDVLPDPPLGMESWFPQMLRWLSADRSQLSTLFEKSFGGRLLPHPRSYLLPRTAHIRWLTGCRRERPGSLSPPGATKGPTFADRQCRPASSSDPVSFLSTPLPSLPQMSTPKSLPVNLLLSDLHLRVSFPENPLSTLA